MHHSIINMQFHFIFIFHFVSPLWVQVHKIEANEITLQKDCESFLFSHMKEMFNEIFVICY
jgi:hypothetical protein